MPERRRTYPAVRLPGWKRWLAADVPARTRPGHLADELCPVRPVAPVSHGEVIEALVANRLTAPAPLVQVEAWAAAMAVDEVYGIEPHLLNDDRLGRALDAMAPQPMRLSARWARRRSASSGWAWRGCTGI